MSLNIAYYGVPGSFSEQALLDYFPNNVNPINNEKFEGVFKELEKDDVHYGVVPIENSSTGPVSEIYDLLNTYPYHIVGEVFVKVEHHLLATKDATLESIQEVYSHPQAFEQCRPFLDQYNWSIVPHFSTASSAEHVKNSNNPKIASISSKKAAELYGLQVLAPNINYNTTNTTRFIILGKSHKINSSCNKISVVFTTEHKAGALYSALKSFSEYNINMLKIESRPVVHTPWQYYFYIDFEGNLDNPSIKKAINSMENDCVYFKLLGNYKSATL
ncbi:chorismate mutase [Natranaerovirga pectinivora]|uniref:Prephenate dehydratase n=1 Tax=Natranaerovirga pectinivora TaxID=682400 RepID=A0A4R3MI89_9FIRM|nr:prephenate dehydratase [Natranaerovirga pectinivora]TCT12171.1 chorismate mutase [Natranaerovirga pectinivora]